MSARREYHWEENIQSVSVLIPGHTPQESRFPGNRNVLGFTSSGCSPSLFPPWIEVCVGSRTHSLCWRKACFPGRIDLRSQLSMVNLSCRWDRRVAAGQKWGPVESSPGMLLPSCSTADKWILETDGAICKPNWRRQIQWRGKQYLPSPPTDGQALHLLPSYKIHFQLPVFKIPTGNGYMGIKIRESDNKWKLKDLGAKKNFTINATF